MSSTHDRYHEAPSFDLRSPFESSFAKEESFASDEPAWDETWGESSLDQYEEFHDEDDEGTVPTLDGFEVLETGAAQRRPILRVGSRGNDVRDLQRALTATGFATSVDGVFGASTKAVVRSFQKARGLVADGVVGRKAWIALKAGAAAGANVAGGTAAGSGHVAGAAVPYAAGALIETPDILLGTLVVSTPSRRPFRYEFSRDDLIWTAKLMVHEAGGHEDADNAAVLWAMFNRYALFAHAKYPSFTLFIQRYSTTLQPVLRNKRAAERHWKKGDRVYKTTGGFYKDSAVPKGQLVKHLQVQSAPWSKVKPSARRLATRALRGELPNPGIGVASEFASTRIYYKQRFGEAPTKRQWLDYTKAFARRKKWVWVDVPGINPRKNAFFVQRRVKSLPTDAVRILPASDARHLEVGESESDYLEEFGVEDGNDFDETGSGGDYNEPEIGGLEVEQGRPSDPISLAIRAAIYLGTRDESKLTNLVFFIRHPERGGRAISAAEHDFEVLRDEWLSIRNDIVRPLLGETRTSRDRRSGSKRSGSGATGKLGPLAAVTTRLASSGLGYTTRGGSRDYGTPETIRALEWIAAQWAARNSNLSLMINDISQSGGGRIRPHKSHRIGLDADVQLRHGNGPVDMTKGGYSEYRPSIQELVNIIESNPVLPVKTIGFMDSKITGRTLRPWHGHVRHLHIRFCMPESRRSDLNLEKVRVLGDPKTLPNYECKVGESEFFAAEETLDANEAESEPEGVFYDEEDAVARYHSPFIETASFEFDSERVESPEGWCPSCAKRDAGDRYRIKNEIEMDDDASTDNPAQLYQSDDEEACANDCLTQPESHEELRWELSSTAELGPTTGSAVEVAAATAEFHRLDLGAEAEALMDGLWDSARGLWERALIAAAVASGELDENRLTNLLFFRRHPERDGRSLSRKEQKFAQLSAEWLGIRKEIVRRILRSSPTSPVAVPKRPVRTTPQGSRIVVPWEPLRADANERFREAVAALRDQIATSADLNASRYLCWLDKLESGSDDRVIEWARICPAKTGALGAAFVIGACDISRGMPVGQEKLEAAIDGVEDLEDANRQLHFITYMRSQIVFVRQNVSESLQLDGFRRFHDEVGRSIEKLGEWSAAPLGGSSAMPAAYRAINSWLVARQREKDSVYSCF